MSSLNKIKTISRDKKRLLSNFFSLSLLQLFSYILPLLTLPYLVRKLGVENYGLVIFAQSFISFFSILVDYGFNLSATRELAVNRKNKDKVREIYSSVLIIKFFIFLFAFLIFSLIVFSFEKFSSHLALFYLTFLSVFGQAFFPLWFFQGMERMKYITLINISSRTLFTLAIFIFIRGESDYLLLPFLNALGMILSSFYAFYLIKKKFKVSFTLQKFSSLKFYFKDSSHFFLSRLSVSLYTSANAFILGIFTNNASVAYYSIAEKLYQAMQTFYGPITQVLYPYIAKERKIAFFKKVFYLLTSLNILGILFLYFAGAWIFAILFGHKITLESLKVFHILLLANVFVIPSILLGYPFLGALGFAKNVNSSVIFGSLFHLLGIFILILTKNITIYNLAYMIIFTEIFVLSLRISSTRKKKLWQKQ